MRNIAYYIIAFLLGMAAYWGIGKLQLYEKNGLSASLMNDTIDQEKLSEYYEKLTKPVNLEKASQILSNYLHKSGDDRRNSENQTKYIWLSIPEVKRLVEVFESKSVKATGMRIYPGIYSKDEIRRMPGDYDGPPVGFGSLGSKFTLFFVPTMDSVAGSIKWPKDIMKIDSKTSDTLLVAYFADAPFENETTQCPPPSSGCIATGANLLNYQFETSGNGRLRRSPNY